MVVDFRSFMIDFCGDISDDMKRFFSQFVFDKVLHTYESKAIWTAEIKAVNSIERVIYEIGLFSRDMPEKEILINNRGYTYQIEREDSSIYFFCNDQEAFAIYNEIESKKIYAFTNNDNYWLLSKFVFLSIIHHAKEYPITLFHSAGAVINRKGMVFLGRSGEGKTTITQFLICYGQKKPQDFISILSDETIMLYKNDKAIRIAGTPWSGRESIVKGESSDAILNCIFCLKQDNLDYCRRITSKVLMMKQLIPQVYSQAKSNNAYNTIVRQLLLDTICEIPMYELHFTYSDKFIHNVEKLIYTQ